MKFIFRMARRELRSSWPRLLLFFVCIAIGVGSIVALRSMTKNVHRAVASEARALLTADLRIDSERQWSEEALETINRLAAPPLVEARVETIESVTMVRPADPEHGGASLIELKGIESGFPLVGDFLLTNGQHFDYSLVANNGAVVSVALLDRLELRVDDEIKIGNTTFQIRGAFSQEPGSGGGFRLGPRVFVERAAVDETGLTGFGSRARRRLFFRTTEGQAESLARLLKKELRSQAVSVRTYRDAEESLNESFMRAENYLSLTGLVILVLGGIGISNVTRVFVEQKKKTIAVLKCVGGTGRKVTVVYLIQVAALGTAGSLLGLLLARTTLFVVEKYYSDILPRTTEYALDTSAVAQGIGVGLLISLLFSAVPLLTIRHIKPSLLLRDVADTAPTRFDLVRWLAAGGVLLGLLLLVSWQAGSLKIGLYFLGGLGATALTLFGAAALLVSLVKRIKHVSSFTLRQAVNSLHRPGNQTKTIVMVVGLGVFLVLSIHSIQANLIREFDLGRQGQLPNMVLIDVQKDQREGVTELVEELAGEKPSLIPTIRARIVEINGKEVDLEDAENRRERGRLGRDYVVTYRSSLESNESVIAGRFWDPVASPEPEVSIERSMRGLGGLDLGSTISFDVQGRKITARVTSIRNVEWRNSRAGFLVLFRPGVIEDAPTMFIGTVNGPTGEIERARFQRTLLDQFPNVSVIDVTEIVRTIKRIAENVTLAVSFLGGFVFLSGGLILIGSIAMTKFQRVYETAVLKTLGARRKTLLTIMLTEYGLIGFVAGVIGSSFAIGLSYVASRQVLNIAWTYTPDVNIIGIGATMLLVTVVGAVSTMDVLSRKPLAVLRTQ